KDVARACFLRHCFFIAFGGALPQPGWHRVFFNRTRVGGNGFAGSILRKQQGGFAAPAIRILEAGFAFEEMDQLASIDRFLREMTLKTQRRIDFSEGVRHWGRAGDWKLSTTCCRDRDLMPQNIVGWKEKLLTGG